MDSGIGGPSAFGMSLFRYRQAAGLSQEALAEASGMSVRALRDLERGRTRAAQQRSAEILADALGLRGTARNKFLAAAREGRRRAPVAVRAMSRLPQPVELVGRAEELARLHAVAECGGGTVVVAGPPGVGKTALALFAAQSMRPLFPDGGIWVDLRGMDDHPLTVGVALERLLRALGVPDSEVPAAESDRIDMYRATLAGRRVLVLLDNVADEAQVRPLLAGVSGALTVVTCRRALAGLENVRWLWLEPLASSVAVELLAGIVGDGRVRREPEAAAELVALCGKLPLAVRIASNRLVSRPHWSMSYLVEQLRDERVRLDALSVGDLQVRSAFEMSYRRLSAGARVLFRRLSEVPGADFGSELAVVVTGLSAPDMFPLLDELVDAGMLQPTRTDGRFQFHDLIRLFAVERFHAEETLADHTRLSGTVLGHLLRTARAAGATYLPEEERTEEPAGAFDSPEEAGEWLVREESNWLSALWVAAERGRHREVLELAGVMLTYADLRWLALPWAEIFQLGVDAARALGDRSAEAKVRNHLGWAQARILRDIDTALATYRHALAIGEEVGDRREQAWSHALIGARLRLRDVEQALLHARKAVELSADDTFCRRAEMQYRLGLVLTTMGRHAEALAVHRAVLASAADYSGAGHVAWRHMAACITNAIGTCLYSIGDWRQAAETYGTARVMYLDAGSAANAAQAALKEGRCWREAGEHVLARECFHDALELYGNPAPQRVTAEVRAEFARLSAD